MAVNIHPKGQASEAMPIVVSTDPDSLVRSVSFYLPNSVFAELFSDLLSTYVRHTTP